MLAHWAGNGGGRSRVVRKRFGIGQGMCGVQGALCPWRGEQRPDPTCCECHAEGFVALDAAGKESCSEL